MTLEQIKSVMSAKGYRFFTGDRNINLIGIRNDNKLTNEFDDRLFVVIELNGQTKIKEFKEFTTDPGEYYSKQKFLNPNGVAILVPGQYPGMWALGKHRGKYEALVQVGRCTVYRDDNRDEVIDIDLKDEGRFGINMHHAYNSDEINKNSAGCQVHSEIEQLKYILQLCKVSRELYGNSFTYTLLEESDFENKAKPALTDKDSEADLKGEERPDNPTKEAIDAAAEEAKAKPASKPVAKKAATRKKRRGNK